MERIYRRDKGLPRVQTPITNNIWTLNKMKGYSAYDLFQKPVDGLRTKSLTGAVITLLAASVTFLLFLSQIYLYAHVNVSNHLTIAMPDRFKSLEALLAGTALSHSLNLLNTKDGRNRGHSQLQIKVHVTFPHIRCSDLDISHNGGGGNKFRLEHGSSAVKLRVPTLNEMQIAGFGDTTKLEGGCTIQGKFFVPKVGGSFGVHVAQSSWQIILLNVLFHMSQRHTPQDKKAYDPFAGGASQTGFSYNVSHYIHTVDFGNVFPLSHHPLRNIRHIVENESGLGISSITAKLVPTRYTSAWGSSESSYQISIADHFVNPVTLAAQNSPLLPGLSFVYEFTPLEVHHTEDRDRFLTFLASLMSIVGGVFVTVRLVSGVLVETVNIRKKRD